MDFHALRHTAGAWVAALERNPHTVMRFMRHSTLEMTYGQYGHMFPEQMHSAVMRLPNV